MTEEPSPPDQTDEQPSTDERSGADSSVDSGETESAEQTEALDDRSDGDNAANQGTGDDARRNAKATAVSELSGVTASDADNVTESDTRDTDESDVDDSGKSDDVAGSNDEGRSETEESDEDESDANESKDDKLADEDPTETDADDEDSDAADSSSDGSEDHASDVPEDVRSYARFSKVDGATYERVNGFLRERTYVTAREWAMARLCADFRTETGVEMTKIGNNLPELVPFMTDTYSPQAVNQARSAFEDKVTKAGATFLYGAMCDFFTAEELDDLMYEVTEVAKFLLEVEGVELTVDEELDAEERISSVMREVRQASDELRHDGVECPSCGHEFSAGHEHAHE